MSLKIVTISDGFESSTVPSIVDPTILSNTSYYYTITNFDIVNEYVVIPEEPTTPSQVVLSWNGIVQSYGDDFTVSGPNLYFEPGLLSLLVNGDKILIIYK